MRPKTFCTVEGCSRVHEGRGYCSMHYKRFTRHGDPMVRRKLANGERLDWLMNHAGFQGNECLIPPFAKVSQGPANVIFEGKERVASRVMCILAHGRPVNEGLHAAHSCGNGHLSCCTPAHLRWSTPSENAADKISHGTAPLGERSHLAILSLGEAQWAWNMRGKLSQQAIADKLGVSRSAIMHIHVGKNWPEVRRAS
jgi:hypothetical protein